ncbi:hypothetical protein EON79_17990 [bacterium]|nr:MAG: hypothetical protein EON79_17990 [bacterium]
MKSPTFDLSILRPQAKWMACFYILLNGLAFMVERTLLHGLILLLAIVVALILGFSLRRFNIVGSMAGAVMISLITVGAAMLWMRPYDMVPMGLGAFYYALLGRFGFHAPPGESKA